MPPGLTPEQYLAEMAADLNGTVHDGVFDTINRFNRRHNRDPKVGDIQTAANGIRQGFR